MSPLKSVQWLYENLDNPNLIILEANLEISVNKTNIVLNQHIPNAIAFDLSNVFRDTFNSLPNTIPSEEKFTSEAQKLGINNNSIIVVYDTIGIYSSPRAWWLFLTMNHQNVYVLDGGLPEWISSGYTTTATYRTINSKGDFKATFQSNLISNASAILSNIDTQNKVVIDARSPDRFSGETPDSRKNARSGRIPKSKNIYYETVLNQNKLKSKEELQQIFNTNFTENKPIIFSCGSGITACIDALAATVAGKENLSIYDGSWSEWGISLNLPTEKTFN